MTVFESEDMNDVFSLTEWIKFFFSLNGPLELNGRSGGTVIYIFYIEQVVSDERGKKREASSHFSTSSFYTRSWATTVGTPWAAAVSLSQSAPNLLCPPLNPN